MYKYSATIKAQVNSNNEGNERNTADMKQKKKKKKQNKFTQRLKRATRVDKELTTATKVVIACQRHCNISCFKRNNENKKQSHRCERTV